MMSVMLPRVIMYNTVSLDCSIKENICFVNIGCSIAGYKILLLATAILIERGG